MKKFQAPSTKLQISTKSQAPNSKLFGILNFEHWNLFGSKVNVFTFDGRSPGICREGKCWNLRFGIFPNGQALLTTVIFLLFISVAVLLSFSTIALSETRSARGEENSVRAYMLAEAGVEDVTYRITTGKQYASPESLSLDGATTVTAVTTAGSTREVVSRGDVSSRVRAVKNVLTTGYGVAFVYGTQVGDGGLVMENNSQVNGSVFSNGDIVGQNSPRITGDAFVAAGNAPTINQRWEVRDSDFAVGTTQGGIITVVDAAGDVGEYAAIVLGEDGFARISYYDASNKDLKFARCTNIDCSARNITSVDTTGDIGWRYTSIALGGDDFARISYYSNTNGDLKFARCTNEDCTTRNITVVDSSGDVGQFSSMVLGSDGFPIISYHAISGGNLKFTRCLDADCIARNTRVIDAPGTVGTYTALTLDEDGFAHISYRDDTNKDLKYVRCTNTDCAGNVITTVDSTGDLGQYKTSIALHGDGFARISYYDDANGDLKFARCTNEDCTTRNITVVDSGGDAGRYSSMELGSDGYARISYYDASGGNLKFAQCLNDDCASRNISTPDSSGDVGRYASLSLGVDGFGRVGYYDGTNGDLKFIRCRDAACAPPTFPIDVAQSFQPNITNRITDADLYLKKIGSPANATLRIIENRGGSPGTNANDVISTGTIDTSQIGTAYGWLRIALSSTPTINADATYWLVVDANSSDTNYLVWGLDSAAGYTRGNAKQSADWTSGGWIPVSGDFNFRVYMGGADRQITGMTVDARAQARIIDATTVGGRADAFTLSNSTVGGNVNANAISNCTIGGNASYNIRTSCTVGGTSTTPTVPQADLSPLAMPISDSALDDWEREASLLGTTTPASCPYKPAGGSTIQGVVTCDVSIEGTNIITLTGILRIIGNFNMQNSAQLRLAPSFGRLSGIVIADNTANRTTSSKVKIQNSAQVLGSGQPSSYIMLVSRNNSAEIGGGEDAVDVGNSSTAAIYYAPHGMTTLQNNVNLKEVTAWKILIKNSAAVTYETGLADVQFSSGPTGGFRLQSWNEVE